MKKLVVGIVLAGSLLISGSLTQAEGTVKTPNLEGNNGNHYGQIKHQEIVEVPVELTFVEKMQAKALELELTPDVMVVADHVLRFDNPKSEDWSKIKILVDYAVSLGKQVTFEDNWGSSSTGGYVIYYFGWDGSPVR
jgi:hypothetical protein